MGVGLGGLDPALALPPTPQGADEARRLAGKSPLQVAREFEIILMTQIIGAMRKTVPPSALGESSTTRMMDGAFDQELARELVGTHGLGLAEQMVQQMGGTAPVPTGMAYAPAGHVGAAYASDAVRATGVVTPAATAAEPAETGAGTTGAALVLPVDGEVTSGFGMRADPFTGRERFHGGVDVAAPAGSDIRTVADGEVVFAGRRGRSGNVVEVQHADGIVTSYAHAARTLVAPGQKVGAGDVIATVGSTGRSTGPHVHFTVRRDGEVIDPASVFGGDAVTAGPSGPTGA